MRDQVRIIVPTRNPTRVHTVVQGLIADGWSDCVVVHPASPDSVDTIPAIVTDHLLSPAAARNRGAAGAQRAFLCFLDDDVVCSSATLDALVERRKEYVEAAQSLGLSNARVVFRHIMPNCLAPVIVIVTVQTAHAIALEATLSFLGVGLPQTEPSLGVLIANGFQYMLSGSYWISFFPGLALLLTIVSINLMGDRIRDVLNPRLEK
jgi:ABC-type proline/glycine betaine transport system permease subunit